MILQRIGQAGQVKTVIDRKPAEWGKFLRYQYATLDFSDVKEPGVYVVRYGDQVSNPFRINADVFTREVWQPTLEYFLPAQMCHMKVLEKYRLWHGACHLDDARMAPVNHNHFDGYLQGPSTLTNYQPGEPVPNLNRGGWHDAGDWDMRVESQSDTIYGLALAWELFHVDYDNTSDRPEDAGHGNPSARRQARRAAAARARRVVGGRRLRVAGPAVSRHHRADAAPVRVPRRRRAHDRQRGVRPEEDAGSFGARQWACRARPTIAGCSPKKIRAASCSPPHRSPPPRARSRATTTISPRAR